MSVDNHIKDQNWVKRLFDYSAEKASNFANLSQIAQSATTCLQDKNFGKSLAKTYYQTQADKIAQDSEKSAYDYAKLAKVIYEDLGDINKATQYLDQAEALADNHFAFAHLGQLAEKLDKDANNLYQKAVAACNNTTELMQLSRRLQNFGMSDDRLRELYNSAEIDGVNNNIQYAEGILAIFKDNNWAEKIYSKLAKNPLSVASREHKLESRYF
jgi:cation transport regulator ChaC